MNKLNPKSLTGRARRRTRTLNVLIACEESQAECIAFRRLGNRAFSCDLQKVRYQYANPKQYVRSSRGKYRSRTFPQVAEALATQWSAYILDELNKSNL